MLTADFFNRDAQLVARELLGKVLRRYYQGVWLSAQIIETEAYYIHDKGSHASLGYTKKRSALFMPAGTIYMYYSRGGDSLNISCAGDGNAVLIKSGMPFGTDEHMLKVMQQLNPKKNGEPRPINKLCAGQTLLCKSLHLRVPDWDQQQLDAEKFFIENVGYTPQGIIQTVRLGIPTGRDEHLPYRFICAEFAAYCTKKPAKIESATNDKRNHIIAKTV